MWLGEWVGGWKGVGVNQVVCVYVSGRVDVHTHTVCIYTHLCIDTSLSYLNLLVRAAASDSQVGG